MITVKKLSPGHRMVRLGFGQHDGRWFIRLDFWLGFVRLSQRPLAP